MEDHTNFNKEYDFMEDETNHFSIEVLGPQAGEEAKQDQALVKDLVVDLLKEISPYQSQVNCLVDTSAQLCVEDMEGCRWALDVCAEARTTSKSIEEVRKRVTEPHRRTVQFVNNYAKEMQQKLDAIINNLTFKLAQWYAIQKEQTEAAQKSMKELSESLGVDMEIVVPSAPENLSSSKASTCSREKISFVVENADLIPDEYWIIDEKVIQKHINLGKRDIPGIKIVKEKTFIVRRK